MMNLKVVTAVFTLMSNVVLMVNTAQAKPLTVAILGDSLIAGYGLQNEDGLVPQLQRFLNAQTQANPQYHQINLINAGVSGDTTAGGAARLAWTLSPDVDALVIALGGNDYLRALPPRLVRENLDQMLQASTQAQIPTLLVDFPVGSNYGADYQRDFGAAYQELSQTYAVPLATGFFTILLKEAKSQQNLIPFLQGDRIHPNANGVQTIVATFGPQLREFAQNITRK